MNDSEKSKQQLIEELAETRRAAGDEALFRGLLDAAPDGMVIADDRGVIWFVNAQTERLFGYTREELVGQPIEILVPETYRTAHVGHRTHFQARPSARRMGTGMELVARAKDGTHVPVEISLSPVETPHGKFVVSAIRDVTERRQVEATLRRQQQELANSNDQLQQFAYVASHDLQEPLRMVSSYLQLLQRRYSGKLDSNADEFIGFAVDGAKRMQALINDLLAYSRVGTRGGDFVSVDLNVTLKRIVKDLEVLIADTGAAVGFADLPTVSGDPSQLTQLFQNLVANGIKFRKPGAAPHVSIEAHRVRGAWEFVVRDDGIGIEPQYFDRIFQIFQRLHTRDEYPGTGIGLAICKRIVDRHGGSIRVESTPGEGSAFVFTLADRSPTK